MVEVQEPGVAGERGGAPRRWTARSVAAWGAAALLIAALLAAALAPVEPVATPRRSRRLPAAGASRSLGDVLFDRGGTVARGPRSGRATRGDRLAGDSHSPRRPTAYRSTGRLRIVPGSTRAVGHGPLWRFDVRVEGGLGIDPRRFAETVESVLFAPRGWTRHGTASFQRVSAREVDFHVVLASPPLTDRLCAPAVTRGMFSCHNDGQVVLNFWRWQHGARSYGRDIARYRTYLVNHEVGHALGRGHLPCPAEGARAPVMMQQTLGVEACRPNAWPLVREHG
jgi:hypothetical protein